MAKQVEVSAADGKKTSVDISKLGVRKQTFVSGIMSPVNPIDQTDDLAAFDRKIQVKDVAFSDISYAEAVTLGKQPWHFPAWGGKGNKLKYTTVIEGRRFVIDVETFSKLQADGLVG